MADSTVIDMSESDDEEETKKIMKFIKHRKKKPNSTLKRVLINFLPSFLCRFVFSDTKEFKITKILIGAGTGGFIGIGFYFLVVHPLSIEEAIRINLMYGLTGSFAAGWSSSTHFRCSTILIITNVLGKEGRAYLMVYVLASIFNGPVTNLEYNMGQIGESLGCTVELQINHTKKIWKILIAPLKAIVRDLVNTGKEMKNDSNIIKSAFNETESEVESTEGYNKQLEEKMEEEEKKTTKNKTLSVQKIFSLRSMLRCEYVIEQGIDKCRDWFDKKHDDCMKAIFLPLLNSLLCLPMKFKFLCNILNLVTIWCKNKLPVDENFGDNFDSLNDSVTNMDSGFSTKVSVVKQEQTMVAGINSSQATVTEDIKGNLEVQKEKMMKAASIIRVLFGCTFFFLFFSAFRYCNQYNKNIRFENYYVTTYFKQIDARRRKKKKHHLLPLRKGEYVDVVFPFSPRIQGPEMRKTIMELMQSLLVVLFLIITLLMDWILYHLLKIVRKHSYISYVFSSHHKFNVIIGGDTFLARLLRRTIGAFNTSSSTVETSNNTECLPNVKLMTSSSYIWSCLPVAMFMVLCILQVYVHRLRRAVAAYYFPKREKRRVLFFYNEYLRKRAGYADTKRKQIMRKARFSRLQVKNFTSVIFHYCRWMRRYIRRRCIVCNSEETKDSYVCTSAGCCTVYCRQCWRDMKRFCFACTPYDEFISDDSEEEYSHDE